MAEAQKFDTSALRAGSTQPLSHMLASGLVLPSLSPLSDRGKLSPSQRLEGVAETLKHEGFDVGWDRGYFQVVSPTLGVQTSPEFISCKNRGVFRPRTTSSVTFTKAPKGGMASSLVSGSAPTSPSAGPQSRAALPLSASVSLPASSFTAGQRPRDSGRFQRLAASVDSLHPLKLVPGTAIPATNMSTLSDGRFKYAHGRQTQPQASASQGGAPAAASQPSAQAEPSTQASRSLPIVQPGLHESGDPTSSSSSTARPATTAGTTGRGSSMRARAAHPMAQFKPSRGQSLMVFNELDRDKNGKITLSELEDAALSLGFSLEQAHKLFHKMDKQKRGFIVASNWGEADFSKVVEFFSLIYMQKFMGLPGPQATSEQVKKYFAQQRLRDVRSLPAAINLARSNAAARGAQSATTSGNPIYEAFKFMDSDKSGYLERDEIRDGFYALGVPLAEDVVDQLFELFDDDGSGSVNYMEFVKRMFPGR